MAKAKTEEKHFDDMTPEELSATGEIVPFEQEFVPVDFDDAYRHFLEELGDVITFEGSPWTVVDKANVVGVPFIIMDIRTYSEDKWKYGVPWVTLLCVTKKPVTDPTGIERNRIVINDGGSGIAAQVTGYLNRSERRKGLLVEGGLRVSEYTYEDDKGNELPAKTYYLA